MERRRYKIQPAEVWDKVRQDYLAGLGAEQVAAKYDVTVHSLRARATKQGWSRYLHAPSAPVDPPPPPPVLFDTTDVGDHPAALAQATLKASSRALAAGLWTEARTLAALAESYRKMAERPDPARGRITAENAPLQLIYDIFTMDGAVLNSRFAIDPDNPDADPVKTAYWAYQRVNNSYLNGSDYARIIQHSLAHNRIQKLEAQLVAAGLAPIEEDTRKGRLLRGEDVILGPDGERIPRMEWERRLDEDLAKLGLE